MHPNSTINLYNPNERLVIQYHFRVNRLRYVDLGFIMVRRKVICILHKRILVSTFIFQMCLAIPCGILDALRWAHDTVPNDIRHSHFPKLGTKVDIWLTNQRRFQSKVLVNLPYKS